MACSRCGINHSMYADLRSASIHESMVNARIRRGEDFGTLSSSARRRMMILEECIGTGQSVFAPTIPTPTSWEILLKDVF